MWIEQGFWGEEVVLNIGENKFTKSWTIYKVALWLFSQRFSYLYNKVQQVNFERTHMCMRVHTTEMKKRCHPIQAIFLAKPLRKKECLLKSRLDLICLYSVLLLISGFPVIKKILNNSFPGRRRRMLDFRIGQNNWGRKSFYWRMWKSVVQDMYSTGLSQLVIY